MKLIALRGGLMSRLDSPAALPRPLRQAEAYWEALRDAGDIPLKADISPPGLEDVLPHIMLLERIAPSVTRFRFSGQAVCDLLGMSANRVPLSDLFTSNNQRQIARAVEDVFAKPSILRVEMDAKAGIGRPSLSAQMILMPLKDFDGGMTQAFGAIHCDGRLGRVPR